MHTRRARREWCWRVNWILNPATPYTPVIRCSINGSYFCRISPILLQRIKSLDTYRTPKKLKLVQVVSSNVRCTLFRRLCRRRNTKPAFRFRIPKESLKIRTHSFTPISVIGTNTCLELKLKSIQPGIFIASRKLSKLKLNSSRLERVDKDCEPGIKPAFPDAGK